MGYHSHSNEADMSSFETRTSPSTGEVKYRVRFRLNGANRAVTFTTEAGARSWQNVLDTLGAAKALALLQDETRAATTDRTVADQVDHHIEHLTGVEPGTRRRYQHIADAQIRPFFSRVLLVDLTRDHVAQWLNELGAREKPPAPKTIANWHGILSAALSSGVDAGLIPTNPAYRMRLPKNDHDAVEMVFLTEAEFVDLLELFDEFWRPLVLLLALTGMRWGEATALRAGDVDVAARSAHIRQAWKHTEGQGMRLGPPKSKRSRRTVAMPPHLLTVLAPLLVSRKPGDILILNRRGRPVRSNTFHGRVWQPAVRRFQLTHGKKPRIHDLRHSYASWAIGANISLPVIQRQMGHESITTTIDRYGHLARADFDPLLSLGSAVVPAIKPASALGA